MSKYNLQFPLAVVTIKRSYNEDSLIWLWNVYNNTQAGKLYKVYLKSLPFQG